MVIPHLLDTTCLKLWNYPSFRGEVVNILLEKRRKMIMARSRAVPYRHLPERIFVFMTSRLLEYKPMESICPQGCSGLVNVSVIVLFKGATFQSSKLRAIAAGFQMWPAFAKSLIIATRYFRD